MCSTPTTSPAGPRRSQHQRSIEDSQYGNYLSGIAGEFAPDDREWFWNLHSWNEANATWELSNLDLDAYAEPGHIAWAPSFVNVSTVPSPNVGAPDDANACNGHGWEMGSGDSKHCMCDEGYTWGEDDPLSCVPETSEDYNVGHSTITYILNDELEPTVAWPRQVALKNSRPMFERCSRRNNSPGTKEGSCPRSRCDEFVRPDVGGGCAPVVSTRKRREVGAKAEKAERLPQPEAVVA